MVGRWKLRASKFHLLRSADESEDFFLKKPKIDTVSDTNFHITYKYHRFTSHSHIKSYITKFKTQQPITIQEATNLNMSRSIIVVWVVGVAATTSRHAMELVRL
jgi:hypothetical protein